MTEKRVDYTIGGGCGEHYAASSDDPIAALRRHPTERISSVPLDAPRVDGRYAETALGNDV